MRGSEAQVVKSAQLAGAAQVIGVDPTLSRRQRALSFGATHVFTPEEALHAIRELTDGREVDHLIEATGVRILSYYCFYASSSTFSWRS